MARRAPLRRTPRHKTVRTQPPRNRRHHMAPTPHARDVIIPAPSPGSTPSGSTAAKTLPVAPTTPMPPELPQSQAGLLQRPPRHPLHAPRPVHPAAHTRVLSRKSMHSGNVNPPQAPHVPRASQAPTQQTPQTTVPHDARPKLAPMAIPAPSPESTPDAPPHPAMPLRAQNQRPPRPPLACAARCAQHAAPLQP